MFLIGSKRAIVLLILVTSLVVPAAFWWQHHITAKERNIADLREIAVSGGEIKNVLRYLDEKDIGYSNDDHKKVIVVFIRDVGRDLIVTKDVLVTVRYNEAGLITEAEFKNVFTGP